MDERTYVVENELKIMRSVNHMNIIKLIEDFENNDEVVLVMELLQVCAHVCVRVRIRIHMCYVHDCTYTYTYTSVALVF